jgi:hypothetical protein
MMSKPARPLEMMKGAVASHPLAGFFINKNMKSPSPCLHREDERANTTGTNIKSKANSTVETKTSSSSWCSGTKGLARKRNKEMTTGSPYRFASLDRWQPNLDSIVEEYENS